MFDIMNQDQISFKASIVIFMNMLNSWLRSEGFTLYDSRDKCAKFTHFSYMFVIEY